MKVTPVHSDDVYAKMMAAPAEKKNDTYRYELMVPFEKKWACYNIPMKAATENGYDIIMASGMLGILAPGKVDDTQKDGIEMLASDTFWQQCREAIEKSLACFADRGIRLPTTEYLYSILLAEPESPYTILSKGYCGDGGIPGYILAWLVPSAETMRRMPACLAHEANHNVRFQFIKWRNDITLGEMMVNEGLAENFATHLFGEDSVGPWVSETDMQTLRERIKQVIRENLGVQGLEHLNAYLYGDEMAALQGFPPVGLPYCAGYACGYHLVKHYLKKTGKDIVEATCLTASEILGAVEDFWDER